MSEEPKLYDKQHNSPYDRGSADSYYGRPAIPHYYKSNGVLGGALVKQENMTPEQIEAYHAGYDDNTKDGNFKDWG